MEEPKQCSILSNSWHFAVYVGRIGVACRLRLVDTPLLACMHMRANGRVEWVRACSVVHHRTQVKLGKVMLLCTQCLHGSTGSSTLFSFINSWWQFDTLFSLLHSMVQMLLVLLSR
jgi:hypothetical protein